MTSGPEIQSVQFAPAKLTVSLRVKGVREDGYHEIDAEMVSIDIFDELGFGEGDGLVVTGATGLEVPTGDDNLVRRALALTGRTAYVELKKRIPAGAGLGGGSSDAAAVLRWAGVTSVPAAATLGADVPFCLNGGRARVTGIGDVLEPLRFVDSVYTVLTPPFGCSTPDVYAAWDDLGGPRSEGPNDLEPAALVVEPRLAEWRDELAGATGRAPVLAGSGSTWFVDGSFPHAGVVAHATRPVI